MTVLVFKGYLVFNNFSSNFSTEFNKCSQSQTLLDILTFSIIMGYPLNFDAIDLLNLSV